MTTYTYDSLDRVSSKTTPDGTVNYTYTTDGKISSVTDSTGTTMFTYNNMDGLTRVDYPDGNYVSYSYDEACRLTGVTTPFGTTSYEYDLLDRLTRVVDRNGYATVYEYDANGNRTAVHYANGYTTTYDYDLLNRLIRQETIDNDGNAVVQYIYTLGAAGERLKVTELNRTVEYSYDSLYRLTSETITEGENTTVYTYAYDNVSNRILKTVNGEETVYTYNALNQLVYDGDTTYEYDLNGNLVRVIGSAHSALYEYNAENKLVKATIQNGNLVTVETYTYDYEGNRTSKTTHKSNGEFEYIKYLNDNSSLTNVLAEIDSEGNAVAFYTVGADLISQERDGKVSVYLYDGHGSVVGLADESGRVTDTYCYDAFGNLIDSTGITENCYRYCGEQFDESTGLYYLRARYMDTVTGRFISQDSYEGSIDDPISLHKYLYANSNPVMYSDPSGYTSLAQQMSFVFATSIIASTLLIPSFSALLSDLVMGLTNVVESFYCAIFTAPLQLINYIATGVKNSLDIAQEVLYSLTDDINTAKEIKVSKHDKNDTGPYIYTVYFLTDDTGQVAYVGRTKNLFSRMKQHEKTDRKKLHLAFYISGLSYEASRGIEQFGMMIFHTLYRTALVCDENGNLQSENIGNGMNGVGSNNRNAITYFNLGANSMRYVINQIDNAIKSLYD